MIEDKKKCKRCDDYFTLDNFYKVYNSRRYIYSANCKECCKELGRIRYIRNRDEKLKKTNAYFKTEKGRKKAYEITLRMIKNHPDRYKARYLVRYAKVTGKLLPKPCEMCGSSKVEAHHDDYSKPLNVRWLCRKHHWEVDGRLV